MSDTESQTKSQHRFQECPNCSGDLEYQTRGDILCRDCEGEFFHEIRPPANGTHVLWTYDAEYRLDEVVSRVN